MEREQAKINIVSLFKDEVQMAEEDLVAMEYALGDYYGVRLEENRLLFSDNLGMLKKENEHIFKEIADLNQEFIDKEDYRKCAVLSKIVKDLRHKMNGNDIG